MANLCAGICSSLLVEKGAGYRGFARHRLRAPPRVGWQLCRGISGSFRLEWVAGLLWNQWQLWRGTGGSFAAESVAGFTWNRWQLWRGIRTATTRPCPMVRETGTVAMSGGMWDRQWCAEQSRPSSRPRAPIIKAITLT